MSKSKRLRFVSAASLFDGHDAAINIMRRVLQSQGAEVIHLGHDRSVEEIAVAAVEEDAHGIAISSYQGGHVEFFSYLVQRLEELGRPDIPVFGGGGGTITDREIDLLHSRGVEKIYSVEDGRRLGLVGMIRDVMERAAAKLASRAADKPSLPLADDTNSLSRAITWLEELAERAAEGDEEAKAERQRWLAGLGSGGEVPILGITGTGGAGKSSLTDELLRRLVREWPERRVAVLSVDPTRKRSGGALLGDRIRMNALSYQQIFMRSLATRQANAAVSVAIDDILKTLKSSSLDLIILETAGIGQSGTEVAELSDLALYVMTPEFGAPSQLEKIDMLDYADIVAINKADKVGADDALRHVQKQMQRNRAEFGRSPSEMPAYTCRASQFGDAGVDRLFKAIFDELATRAGEEWRPSAPPERSAASQVVMPADRVRYLSEIAQSVRAWHKDTAALAAAAHGAEALNTAAEIIGDDQTGGGELATTLAQRADEAKRALPEEVQTWIDGHDELRAQYQGPENVFYVRGREIKVSNYVTTLSGSQIPKVSLPPTDRWDELVKWRRSENLPGHFPFTAGVFPFKRDGEDPTRMFAGEGTPERTNRRFHYLSRGQKAKRLSTAFDSVTLYGHNPEERPDVLGKIGNSGVSVATLDDAKRLYSGFDLTAPATSVSMTINGPAPVLLAMFFNAAIDQQIEATLRADGRWDAAIAKAGASELPTYRADSLPEGHDGTGLGLLGLSGDQLVGADEYEEIKTRVLKTIRGTVQADILKEDQAQNTCIFSTEFALRMMGDIQEYFVEREIRNFYSVSISGYHIAEAGANPITQLALTLANGFTYVEYYRSRGMEVDQFARNLSFFFSNGMDAEYTVIGRVARRIWAIAMRELYGADTRSQQLKYHIQTSGRSLHAQEIAFNDIRTTLQAFYALADNCNSLHTNAYDEAITTPTEESVRRAVAIQLILNRELGLLSNENALQGSYFVEALTDLVEEAVLQELERLTDRGGVLGAMELMYQRSKIQEESLLYESRKHSGELPIIGVNTFLEDDAPEGVVEVELARSTDEEKRAQIDGVKAFEARNADKVEAALRSLQEAALRGDNLFEELMETVKVASLGQISAALFAVGGQYRRSM